MKDDIDRVIQIARRYGVKLFITPSFARFGKTETRYISRGLPVSKPHDKATSGPRGHWCHPRTKSVWFDSFDVDGPETHLHEVCHVIMCSPGGINELSEDVVLMPFERMIARQCLSHEGYKKVLDWQVEYTQIDWWDKKGYKHYDYLANVPNHTRWFFWRQSHAALRAMGAIKNGRVTWKWPDWRLAPKDLMDRGNLGGE